MARSSTSRTTKRLRRRVWQSFSTSVRVASSLRLGRRFPVLRRVYWSVQSRLKPKHALVAGRWMEVHRDDVAIADALLKHGVYEPFETALLSRLLNRGAIFLDVGANIGYHTLAGAEAVGEEGRVVAVEPSSANLRLLRANVAAAGFTNVTIVDCAAGAVSGQVLLYESASNAGDHRTYAIDGRQGHKVQVHALDEVLEDLKLVPDVVKIDIQGFERWAIEGLRRSIGRAVPCAILTEFWTTGLLGASSSAIEYFDLLDELGFEMFRIDEDNRRLQPFERDDAAVADIDTNLLGLKGVAISAYDFARA